MPKYLILFLLVLCGCSEYNTELNSDYNEESSKKEIKINNETREKIQKEIKDRSKIQEILNCRKFFDGAKVKWRGDNNVKGIIESAVVNEKYDIIYQVKVIRTYNGASVLSCITVPENELDWNDVEWYRYNHYDGHPYWTLEPYSKIFINKKTEKDLKFKLGDYVIVIDDEVVYGRITSWRIVPNSVEPKYIVKVLEGKRNSDEEKYEYSESELKKVEMR